MAQGAKVTVGREGGNCSRPFSIVVPFRDTPREREFARASLPSAAALGPDEIVIGVDSPPPQDLEPFLKDAVAGGGPHHGAAPCRVVPVPVSEEWAMHPAHVVHECFGRCSTKTVLLYNIDTRLRPAVLGGRDLVGRGDVAVVSYALRLLTSGALPTLRYMTSRARARVRGGVNSGTFWVHLPYYFEHVDASRYAAVANGFDTYIHETLGAVDGLRLAAEATLGADSMDRENGDLEWRQFGYGVWQYANRHTAGGSGVAAAALRALGATAGRRVAVLIATANIAKHAAANGYPYALKGWRWARDNPDSEAVKVAASVSYPEWAMYHEPGQVRSLMDWPERGTGFASAPAGRRSGG